MEYTRFPIRIGARSSPLSQIQVQEVLEELQHFYPSASFEKVLFESYGDKALHISLIDLDKQDFFTQEIDEALLEGSIRVGIHSAKDLPVPLPTGLCIAAITKGIDPSDSLVTKGIYEIGMFPSGAVIGVSSARRREVLSKIRGDFFFKDIRGTIGSRLSQMYEGLYDGVVIAEAALIRLGLTHISRIHLEGIGAPFQGRLAIVCREDDDEMKRLFHPLNFVQNAEVFVGGV